MIEILNKLFTKVPGSTMSNELILALIAFGILLVISSFALKYIRRKTKNKICKKYIREYPTGLLIFGILDLFLVWVRLESVPLFAMRVWWVIYWIALVVWVVFKIRKTLIIKKRIARNQSK